MWTFAESSNYVSLEFTTDGLYTFLSKTPFTRAAENNIYLLSGAYSVAADLHELTLSDFGKITISDVGNGKASMTIVPTGRNSLRGGTRRAAFRNSPGVGG